MAKREPIDARLPAVWAREYGVSTATLAAADVLHGWTLHQHHEGEAILLTESAFLEAVAAVDSNPTIPAESATSPHRHRRL